MDRRRRPDTAAEAVRNVRPVSNGPTEAVNLLVKRIKRVGFGFRNFANYRLLLLLLLLLLLRCHLAHSPHDTGPRPVTTFHVVEPGYYARVEELRCLEVDRLDDLQASI